MTQKLRYAVLIFVLSMLGLLGAAYAEVPLAYVALVPALAGACIAAVHRPGRKGS